MEGSTPNQYATAEARDRTELELVAEEVSLAAAYLVDVQRQVAKRGEVRARERERIQMEDEKDAALMMDASTRFGNARKQLSGYDERGHDRSGEKAVSDMSYGPAEDRGPRYPGFTSAA